eukprot:CAMPEP_0198332870 /NCGR_PEP_ID=MMETSP1450-20131203/18563_1 /TAXON_ID=753684 ORGANISM="Madagascaria erythrocladiodes, Strain CCMP3234" /NCGR_SAMPLE_ID=MMETSP1450 /ASSEMBLY_ACC=CAM_ASM_001115 /LENGTH=295 /DNA_ID=CAMNT_0044037341 /DNA_START=47 /DNA_END=934 /DNA_ORIENTATION=+
MDSFPVGPKAVLFDLDGTLTETELLKARSYAHVVRRLRGCNATDTLGLLDHNKRHSAAVGEAVAAEYADPARPCSDGTPSQEVFDQAMGIFMRNIGSTSEHICRTMVEEMKLRTALQSSMEKYDVTEPWRALYKLRKEEYYTTFATPDALRAAQYAHNVASLRAAAAAGLPLGVVTSSSTADAERVLEALGVRDLLKFVVGADQVARAKPDPEPYLLAAKKLGEAAGDILVFEDSVNGVRAAVGAGTQVIAVANPFTRVALQEQEVLPRARIAFESVTLGNTIAQVCAEMTAKAK